MRVEKTYAEKNEVTEKERNERPLVNNMYPKSASLEVRMDLVDCEIAICTLDILETFTDNFDKESLKDGFINWQQENEVIEDRVRAFIVMSQDAYFGRIFNPRTYAVVSNDIICRRAYPLVIDKKAVDPLADYQIKMPNIYIDRRAQTHVSSAILNNVIIGAQTEIGANSLITYSNIGCDCTIGRNVKIINSVIGKKVVIHDNSTVIGSIIWDNVVINRGTIINQGCMVTANVETKEDVTIPEGSVCSLQNYDTTESKFVVAAQSND